MLVMVHGGRAIVGMWIVYPSQGFLIYFFFLSNCVFPGYPIDLVPLTAPWLGYSWTVMDFWACLLRSAIYATLTLAQPFFAYVYLLLYLFFWLSDWPLLQKQR
jgi:hypothetical protein